MKEIWRDFTRVAGLLPNKPGQSPGDGRTIQISLATSQVHRPPPTFYGRLEKSPWSVRISSTPTDSAARLDGLLRTPHFACVYEHGGAAAPGVYMC